MQTETVLCLNPRGIHRMQYRSWGDPNNPQVLICVHGLARNGRDFDDLAQALSTEFRVICPDVVGRGSSDWLPEGSPYEVGQYVQDMMMLIARLNVDQVSWLGTSMGGIIGMALAAFPDSPIKRLILNDIGALVPKAALKRISQYMGEHRFDNLAGVEQYMRRHYPALRHISDAQWVHLAQHGVRKLPNGQLALHYDPALSVAAEKAAAMDQDVDLWPFWQAIRCPRALIWGQESDVLLAETVQQMEAQTPGLELLTIKEVGHAPSLMEPAQIKWLQEWFLRNPIME